MQLGPGIDHQETQPFDGDAVFAMDFRDTGSSALSWEEAVLKRAALLKFSTELLSLTSFPAPSNPPHQQDITDEANLSDKLADTLLEGDAEEPPANLQVSSLETSHSISKESRGWPQKMAIRKAMIQILQRFCKQPATPSPTRIWKPMVQMLQVPPATGHTISKDL